MHLAYRVIGDVKTKVRRLGYFSALVRLIGPREVNESLALSLLTSWSQDNKGFLREYCDGSGEVTSQAEARKYLQCATALDLLSKTMGSYRVSRRGHMLYVLLGQLGRTDVNPFCISKEEKVFYTYHLLSLDADVLLLVLDSVKHLQAPRLSDLQNNFRDAYIRRLTAKMASTSNEAVLEVLLERRNIAEHVWKNPKRYAEHIIPSRANWLLDLGILEPAQFRKHRYSLTNAGQGLARSLVHVVDGYHSDVTDDWLQEKFFSEAVPALLENTVFVHWDNVDKGELIKRIGFHLEAAFRAFQMAGVEAIALYEGIRYVCMRLATHDSMLINEANLMRIVGESIEINGKRYEVRKLPRTNESFLMRG